MSNRRDFFSRLAAASAGFFAADRLPAQHEHHQPAPAAPGKAAIFETPDLAKLPSKIVDGVREFHLVAEPVRTEFHPGRVVDGWGFNGSVPGPSLEMHEGERVRVIFENHLPEMTALHWHGFEVPMEMDGSVGLGQDPVPPGGRYVYEFTIHQSGTFFYHSHFPMQEMMGMLGFAILHPKQPFQPAVDKDYGLIIQEWMLLPNNPVRIRWRWNSIG
jgi:FtsP/CotA-like multicopper oxidase with cupredoxin domain